MSCQDNDAGRASEPIGELDFPSVRSVIAALEDLAPSAPGRDDMLDQAGQEQIFHALQQVLHNIEGEEDGQEHHGSNEQPDVAAERREKCCFFLVAFIFLVRLLMV